jgi:hypothetical protein
MSNSVYSLLCVSIKKKTKINPFKTNPVISKSARFKKTSTSSCPAHPRQRRSNPRDLVASHPEVFLAK